MTIPPCAKRCQAPLSNCIIFPKSVNFQIHFEISIQQQQFLVLHKWNNITVYKNNITDFFLENHPISSQNSKRKNFSKATKKYANDLIYSFALMKCYLALWMPKKANDLYMLSYPADCFWLILFNHTTTVRHFAHFWTFDNDKLHVKTYFRDSRSNLNSGVRKKQKWSQRPFS